MIVRRINQALWGLAALLGAGALVTLIDGVVSPIRAELPPDAATARGATDAQASALPSLASLEPIWNLHLHGELSAPAEPQPQPSLANQIIAPGANIPVTLVGTIGDSLAMLQNQSGQVEVKAVGESFEGIEIIAIHPSRVEVRYNGRVMILQKAPESQQEM